MSFFRPQLSTINSTNSSSTQDVEIPDPPTDSISCLSFSNAGEYLAVGSWDNSVRIYEVNPQGTLAQGKAMYQHQGAVLDLCWSKDGMKVVSAGTDNAARLFDLQTGQNSQVAQHDAPIKAVRWIESPQGAILATGSWDKTLKYWDMHSTNPIASVNLPERCYTMDSVYPLLVVGTAERHVLVFDLRNPTVPVSSTPSPLAWQTRVITCFPSGDGYALGSIEGRIAIQFVDKNRLRDNYSFRCHRKEAPNDKSKMLVYAINDINFHPVQGTFTTASSDGTFNYWDKDARARLKSFDPAPGPITATAFNKSGTIFAYAVSYDWSKGYSGMTANSPVKIMLHAVKEEEVKKRPLKR